MQFSKWVTLSFGALCLVAVAGVLNARHLYYMAAILITLPGVSYCMGRFAMKGLVFGREIPAAIWAGEEGSIVYSVQNPTSYARFFLAIRERLPEWMSVQSGGSSLFNAPAREVTRIPVNVRFMRRGVYAIRMFEVTAMDPLGVFAFVQHVACEGEVVVYPQPNAMDWDLTGGTGDFGVEDYTRNALRGPGTDPDGVRAYMPGDSLRHIHWRQTARTGKISVIEYEEPRAAQLVIALDLHRPDRRLGEADAGQEAIIQCAASVAAAAIRQDAAVRLLLPLPMDQSPADGVALSFGRGQMHLYHILDALARAEAGGSAPLSNLIADGAGTFTRGTALLCISDRQDLGLAGVLAGYVAEGTSVDLIRIGEGIDDSMRYSKQSRANRFTDDLRAAGVRILDQRLLGGTSEATPYEFNA